ncbi:(2Fe-2S)-binding protein [Streptomyces zaomyceticus]|uniref:(2Fe-2S)-binding protein n=1 Tax=Streptomyces zaomyceticus TaxID=68286 RepID=UPI0036C665D1
MSSNEQHGNQGGSPGGWEPIPQSEGYDGDATAFVQLPPDFMLDGVPLEAPGHGYVPPMITPLQPLTPTAATDPAATGAWNVHLPTQAEHTQYFDGTEYAEQGGQPGQGEQGEYVDQPGYYGHIGQIGHAEHAEELGHAGHPGHPEEFGHAEHPGHPEELGHAEHFDRDPHATAEWRFTEATPAAAEPGATGQWTIPAVPDMVERLEAAEEPGAFAAPDPRPYAEAPATLPGGAPAPWALPEEPASEAAAAFSGEQGEEQGVTPEAGPETGPVGEPVDDTADAAVAAAAPDADAAAVEASDEPGASDPVGEPDPATGPDLGADAVLDAGPDPVPGASLYASTDSDEHPHTSYTLRVNGADRPVTGSWIGESLLYVLRERLGLAGAKDGCSQGECGACNVQVDGRLVASCLVPAATAAGSEVRTVEGLAVDGKPSDVQRAMAKCGTVQCGFCIPGMCMTVHDLLEGNHAPTELEARQALAGNLCRCSGYRGVLEAVRDVVAEREASAAATAADTADEPRVPHQIPHPHDGGMA